MKRRDLIIRSALAVPVLLAGSRIIAAEPPMLAVDDPIAIALRYVEDGGTIDPANYLRPAPDGVRQACSNCALFQSVRGEAGTCSAIPGKLVKGAAWCSAWSPRS